MQKLNWDNRITYRKNTYAPFEYRRHDTDFVINNLIFSSLFEKFSGSDLIDSAGSRNDLTLSGAAKKAGAGNGKALYFDGTDDYCLQKVYDSEAGTVSINVTSGSAALTDDGQDFTAYIGDGSNNQYIAIIKDQESDYAWGYCGALNGGVTSIKLAPHKDSSWQAMTGVDSGFDTGDTLTYEIWKSGFQPFRAWVYAQSGTAQSDDSIASFSTPNRGELTICALIKGPSQSNKTLISKFDYGINARGIRLSTDTGKFRIIISEDGTAAASKYYESSQTTFDDIWHIISFTFSSSDLKLYFDGIYDDSPTKITDIAITHVYDTPISFALGLTYNSGAAALFGEFYISALYMYNRALSAIEVKNLTTYIKKSLGLIR